MKLPQISIDPWLLSPFKSEAPESCVDAGCADEVRWPLPCRASQAPFTEAPAVNVCTHFLLDWWILPRMQIQFLSKSLPVLPELI